MRSHAKAASAGSTQRQANGLGRIVPGALATRGASLEAKGSGAPAAKRLLLPVGTFAAILALVLSVGSASAADGVVSFFGGSGSFQGNEFVLEGGQFRSPAGVAVNQEGSGGASAGDVYVVDRFGNRVQQFSAAGTFIRAFGLDVGGAGVHVCTVAASCEEGTESGEAAGLSNPQGIAIDQANGNVYVTDQGNARIDVFSANGTFQAAFGYGVDTGAAALELCTAASTCQAGSQGAEAGQFSFQLGYPAVAPTGSPNAGDLYVPNSSNSRVDQFEPTLTAGEVTGISFVKGFGWGVDTGAAEFEQCTTASVCQEPNTSSPTTNPGQFGFGQPQALAVDSNGNLYTAESSENNRAQKFDPSGNPVAFAADELNGFPGPIDVAVDKTNDHLFALKEVSGEKRILEFSAAGGFIATHAEGTTMGSANGFAVVQGTTNFYMSTDNGVPVGTEFSGPPGVFFLGTEVPPTATVEAPSPLSSSSATIKGKVNPTGFKTTYRFEFSSDGGFTWTNVPASDVNVGNGTSDVAVSQVVNGLVGGHEYRYRIVATKPFGAGTTTSSEEFFTTPASAPTVPATFSSAVTTKAAMLGAEINPQNQATSYHFEYGTADCASNPCTSVPVPDAGIGSGGAPVKVLKEVTGLQPETTYHFRVFATNATGTTEGPDTVLHTYPLPTTDTNCSNQAFRFGASARLPDCRAYEMVSPVDKNGGDIVTLTTASGHRSALNQSAASGDKFTFSSFKPFAGAQSGPFSNQYLATRGPDGWTTEAISPPQGETVMDFAPPGFHGQIDIDTHFKAFTPDLSSAWLIDGNVDPLTPDTLPGSFNYYRRDNSEGSFESLTKGPAFAPTDRENALEFQGFSTDGSHAVFRSRAALTPNAIPGENSKVYDFHNGQLDLVSVLPGGAAYSGVATIGAGTVPPFANSGDPRERHRMHAVSADGSRIFWTGDPGGGGQLKLYVRIDGETTVAVSEAPGTQFWTASIEGSKAVYSVPNPPFYEDLYVFDVDTETPTLIAGKVSGVVGASDDLSYIYYTSEEALDVGATAGEWNLYLYHEGSSNFIATLSQGDSRDEFAGTSVTARRPIYRNSRVTPDGRHLAFMSTRSLTGYDNTDAINGEAAREVFRYDADAEELLCVSCNPSGARPIGHQMRLPYVANSATPETWANFAKVRAAAWLNTQENDLYAPHTLSEDGNRIFFNSFDPLVPQDTNGKQDVYQWEAQGTGGCQKAGGCVDLISSGEGKDDSEFVDATPDGSNVFFTTNSSLVNQDPALIDIYDARVGGGYPPPPAPPTPCVGDACQNIAAAPNDPTPASASFRGAGDLVAKKPRRSCRAANRKAKGNKQAQRKKAKHCRRANRRAGR